MTIMKFLTWIFEERVFFNSFIKTFSKKKLQSANLRASLTVASCNKLDHLLRMMKSFVDTLRETNSILYGGRGRLCSPLKHSLDTLTCVTTG